METSLKGGGAAEDETYLTVVVQCRNDDYGGDMLTRPPVGPSIVPRGRTEGFISSQEGGSRFRRLWQPDELTETILAGEGLCNTGGQGCTRVCIGAVVHEPSVVLQVED